MRWRAAVLVLLCCCACATSTHYSTLGVGRSASQQEIKAAYRKLALQHHPDKNPTKNSDDKFKRITEAYETLGDEDRRHKYDQQLRFGGPSPSSSGYSSQGGGFGGAPQYSHQFGGFPSGFQFEGGNPFFKPRPAVPPPRAARPFYCSLSELVEGGAQREFVLNDTPLSRVRDALHDVRAGGLKSAAGEALARTASIAASVLWRFPSLVFKRQWWYVRLPIAFAAFIYGYSQQLPPSPRGKFAFELKRGWRQGTKVVFPASDGARAAAFELRERHHARIRRKSPPSSGDLFYRARPITFQRARRGTSVRVVDLSGNEHEVEVRLTAEELAERREVLLRKVGTGLGLPSKQRSGGGSVGDDASGRGRGDLWAQIAVLSIPSGELSEEDQAEPEEAEARL